MGFLKLEGQDWKWITHTLESSFGVRQLKRLINQQFPEIHREVNWMQAPANVVDEVVREANRQGVLDRVIAAIISERQYRPDLRSLGLYYSQSTGWNVPFESNGLDVGGALERLTITGDPFLDTTTLAEWLIRVERQVCQVRCGFEYGTGFLVAPDLVMTCYHVVQGYLTKKVPLENVQVRFDYKRTKPNTEPPDMPTWIGIDSNWTIPHKPYSKEADTKAGIKNKVLPKDDELDFALLKLRREVGYEIPEGENQSRGWIDLSNDPPIPAEEAPVLIVQHPGRDHTPPPQMPLQITFATPGFEELNANRTRIAYTPSTRKGSSGSPVFDGTLAAVALHHNLGQIHPEEDDLVKNNRGIPLTTIKATFNNEVRQMLGLPSSGETSEDTAQQDGQKEPTRTLKNRFLTPRLKLANISHYKLTRKNQGGCIILLFWEGY